MKCITGKYGLLLAVSCWLLAVSCSSDGTSEQRQPAGSTLQVAPYIAVYQGDDAMSRRAIAAGYSAYSPDHDISIGLYVLPVGTTSASNDDVKLIRYSNGDWHSQATVVTNENYIIYGYMPKSITSSISKSGSTTNLTLTGIPAVTAEDVCFITGVKDNSGDLYQGVFDYQGKATDNYIRLLMDHLYAAVGINFTVDADYSALRTIKLKEMTLGTTTSSSNATVSLSSVPPFANVTYTAATGSASSATFFENAEGIEIKSENAVTIGQSFCCFIPTLGNTLTLVTTYDVYDRKGNKIRENCTATNKLPNLNTVRGQRVTLNLNVAPTYLGQLSEQDLDNPNFTIN